MKEIYLDNSATTPVCDEAKQKMLSAMDSYGNPSSLHKAGFEASRILADARAKILTGLFARGGRAENLVFTSSGTEADNLAVFGTAFAKSRRANRIITTDSEHSAIENSMKRLEEQGFEVIRLSTKEGVIDLEEFKNVMNEKTLLVSVMTVNNETGAVYPIKELFSYAKRINPDVVTHTDAVQGFMKMKISSSELCADLISISAHKIHGPKGVGALYISPDVIKKKQIVAIAQGGGQENGFRSGTENMIGIAGFAAAVERGMRTLPADVARMASLRERLVGGISSLDIRPNIPKGSCAPHILNITLPNIKSETMLHQLSAKGIYVSSGSACSSHSRKASRALHAFGISDAEADCSIRISLSPYNTEEDVDALVAALSEGISKLVRIK